MSKQILYQDRRLRAYKKQKRKRQRLIKKLIKRGMFFGIIALVVILSVIWITHIKNPEITIEAEAKEITLGDKLPKLSVKIKDKGITDKVIEKSDDDDYTYEKLLDDINKGSGYKIDTEASSESLEGTYKIKLELSDEIKGKLKKEWKKKIVIKTVDAELTIKNPIGKWEGNKFKKYDGGYVRNDFVTYKGKRYFLGDDYLKVTGLNIIYDDYYYFNKNGVMKTGWQDIDDGKYYFQETGQASRGFTYIDEDIYMFDEKGKMQTGEITEGSIVYTMNKKGKMESATVKGIDPNKPMVALTYDDGPGDRTDELLDTLKQFGAKATFFMLGNRIEGREETVKRMYDIGCELGNHTYDHPELPKLTSEEIQNQINSTNALIAGATDGHQATVIRPPYGAINDTVKSSVTAPMILWNVDTKDWETKNTQATIDAVMSTVADGNIILMHDIHGSSIDASKQIIPKLIEQGYQLVTVTEMATAKGTTMMAGEAYTDFQ